MSNDLTGSQPGLVDPIDSMIDFSEYDNVSYQSPALSPIGNKSAFARPTTTTTTPSSLLSTSQPMSAPSHQYDQYKQQTGIVPGALANTFAVNQNNAQITGYSGFNVDAYFGMNNGEDVFDFNTAPSQNSLRTPDMDIDFDSPATDANFYYGGETVNPNVIGGQENTSLPSPPGMSSQAPTAGRVWPGMHQQAALAKAQAQQRQQQQMIQQQHQHQQRQSPPKQQKGKAIQPADPIVEQKITQLLNSMRAKPASPEASQSSPSSNLPRLKKEEEDMDEDERLLASDEGKKLTSKERRQLRNKVSARAFRSRRKEYISQLESEIATKVTENGELRTQNRMLVDENKRLTDLTRMLLSSPSFSDFLNHLSANPSQIPQPQPVAQIGQRQDARQLPKDANPYAGQQQNQHQQIGMAMIPEQNMDFSMLSLDTDAAFTFQPQVYAVLETPEISIDTSMLSGKATNFVGQTIDEDEKIDMPVIEHPVEQKIEKKAVVVVDEEFENDPTFALYHDAPEAKRSTTQKPREINTDALSDVDIFGGVEPEKALSRYELVDATEDNIKEAETSMVIARIQRIVANLDVLASRLDVLVLDS